MNHPAKKKKNATILSNIKHMKIACKEAVFEKVKDHCAIRLCHQKKTSKNTLITKSHNELLIFLITVSVTSYLSTYKLGKVIKVKMNVWNTIIPFSRDLLSSFSLFPQHQ